MTDQPIDALKKAEEGTHKRDRIGLAGEAAATAAAGASAWFSAPTIAGLLGGNVVTAAVPASLFGSTWLAGATGATTTAAIAATAATPIGWAIAVTAGITASAYGLFKLIRSGGLNDQRRQEIGKELRKSIQEIEAKNITKDQITIVIKIINKLMTKGIWEKEKGARFIKGVESGAIKIDFAIKTLSAFANELENPPIEPTTKTPEQVEKNSIAARIFTVLKKTVNFSKTTNNNQEPDETFIKEMSDKYHIPREQALQVYKDAPVGENAAKTAKEFTEVFSQTVVKDAFQSLQQTAANMAQGQQAFARYMEMEKEMQAQLNEQLDKVKQAGDRMKSAIDRL